MRLASVVTTINVLVASGFSIVGIIHPEYLVPAESVPTQASLILAMYAAARTIPLALFALWAIYKQAAPALVLLGALAAPCNCWTPESVCLNMILGNALGRSLLLSSNSSWCICFTDPRGLRRKPSADRLSPNVVPVAPDCRREFRETDKQCGLTDSQEQENIYEKRQGTHA
jgi:hypothetical protein